MPGRKLHHAAPLVGAVLLVLAALVLDITTRIPLAAPMMHLVAILVTVRTYGRGTTLVVACLSTLAIVTGVALEQLGQTIANLPADDMLALSALWMITAFLIRDPRQASALSGRRFRETFDHSPMGLAMTDPSGRFRHVNNTLAHLTGFAVSELRGQTLADLTVPEDINRVEAAASAAPPDNRVHCRLARRDGAPFKALIQISRSRDGSATVQVLDPAGLADGNGAARFQAITAGSDEAVLALTPDSTVTWANPAAAAVLGASVAELATAPLASRVHPGDQPALLAALQACASNGAAPQRLPRLRLRGMGGAWVVLQARCSALPATGQAQAAGSPTVVLHGNDITEQMATEEALRRSQQKFSTVFSASPDAIFIVRAEDDVILDLNDGFSRMLGLDRAEAIGMRDDRLAIWASLDQRRQLEQDLRQTREVHDRQVRLLRQGRVPVPARVSARYVELDGELCVLFIVRDDSARQAAELALRESEHRFQTVFQESPDGILILRMDDGVILDVNNTLLELSGHASTELLGQPLASLPLLDSAEAMAGVVAEAGQHGTFRDHPMTFRHRNGTTLRLLVSGTVVNLDGARCLITVARDTRELDSAEAELLQSEERFRSAFDNAPIGMMLVDPQGKIQQVNRLLADMLQYKARELPGRHFSDLLVPDEQDLFEEDFRAMLGGEDFQVTDERRLTRKDGSTVWTTRHTVLQRDPDGSPRHLIVQVADITEMKESQRKMERLAFYDTLTDLANRRLFGDRVEQAVKHANRTGRSCALLYLDLDQFKRVNDTLGHEAGDQLLKEVANRLRACVRQEDTVGRPGGDEFTVLLNEVRDARAAGLVADNILRSLQAPVQILGHELIVTTSIGLTLAPDDCSTADQLTKNADLAMYRAKERGRNNYQFFAEEMNERALERLALEQDLRQALERGEFELWFQPKVRLASQQIVGAEALLRWRHPTRGMVTPDTFIGVAEETGFIVEIGAWTLHEAARCARALRDAGAPQVSIAVNISARQFRDPHLPAIAAEALRSQELDPAWLEFEITETMLMDNSAEAILRIEALRDLGVKLAIDDFGTGYSSLDYLRRLPIHVVKVDRTFVREIPDNADDMAITAAVIAMAHQLNMEVVAEGIERPEQLFFLNEHLCEYGQGFLFAEACPFDKLRTILTAPGGLSLEAGAG